MVARSEGAIARTLATVLGLGVSLAAPAVAAPAVAAPAVAVELDTTHWPVEGNVSVMALPPFRLEAGGSGAFNSRLQLAYGGELGLRNGFLGVGGLRWSDSGAGESISTVYGRAIWRLGSEHTLSLVSGWNHFVDAPRACLADDSGCEPESPDGLLVAASWRYRNEHLWFTVTPQYSFLFSGYRDEPGWIQSLLPWAEIGWRVSPNVGLAFRINYAPFELRFDF